MYVAKRTRFDKEPGVDNKYYHLILLAKNNQGYKNLSKLVSLGFIDGYYYKPRIDLNMLFTLSPEDVYITSACVAGWKYEDAAEISPHLRQIPCLPLHDLEKFSSFFCKMF